MADKQVFVILGMARSGTSVMSRALKALGIDLGEKLTASNKWNPTGFWEDNEIVYQINEKAFNLLQTAWDAPKFISKASQENSLLAQLRSNACALLRKRMTSTNLWAFKDPRTTRLIPFWLQVFKETNIAPRFIIALRNPLSCAESFQRLTGSDIQHGLLLWLVHIIAAINDTENEKRLVVSYDALMQSPEKQLDRLKNNLNLKLPFTEKAKQNFLHEFLDKNLYHFENTIQHLQSHEATSIAPFCISIYALLMRVAHDEIMLDSEDFKTAWQKILEDLKPFWPAYDYIDTLLARHFSLKAYVRQLHKSRLWRLISPLRKLDERLRNYRKCKNL